MVPREGAGVQGVLSPRYTGLPIVTIVALGQPKGRLTWTGSLVTGYSGYLKFCSM